MEDRLQKILAQLGLASRRQAELMIVDGRVKLNGQLAQLGQRADLAVDRIELDGKLLSSERRPQLLYFLLNKPRGVVSTCRDPEGRRTVLDLFPEELASHQGLHPVGRLDTDSSGALLITNDGDLTFYMTHPSHEVEKTYEVWVEGSPSNMVLSRWRDGVILDGRKTLPTRIRVLQQGTDRTLLEVVMREGRNRQIRLVAQQLGHPVSRLHRTAIGNIDLRSDEHVPVRSGSYRPLLRYEINFLKRQSEAERPGVRRG
jgi:pseudouridine synthase